MTTLRAVTATWKMKTQQQNHAACRRIGQACQQDTCTRRTTDAFLQLQLVHFFVANTRVKWKGTPPALSVSHVWSLRGHVQCCGDTRRWADIPGSIPGPPPMDRASQMPSQESCSSTVLAVLGTPCQLNVSGLLAEWSLTQKKRKMEEQPRWIDSLQPCFLATEVGIGRKIMIVVAFYVAAAQNKNEVTSLQDR